MEKTKTQRKSVLKTQKRKAKGSIPTRKTSELANDFISVEDIEKAKVHNNVKKTTSVGILILPNKVEENTKICSMQTYRQ